MQVGCAVVNQQLLSLSLSGDLNYLDRASDRPTKVSAARPSPRAADSGSSQMRSAALPCTSTRATALKHLQSKRWAPQVIKGHRVPILGMAYDRTQHLLYTTSYDGLVLQWNIDDGTTKGFGGKGRSPPMPVSTP